MSTIAIADAASRLDELVAETRSGEEIILTKDDRPVAKIVPLPTERPLARFGSGKDFFAYMAPDFDETPEGFEDYMP